MQLPETSAATARAVESVLRGRRTIRAFKPDPVSAQEVRELLALAATAPSNSNTQPWRVYVLAGAAKAAISEDLVAAFECNELPPSAHFPQVLPQEVAARQEDFGARYYASLDIERSDLAARQGQTKRNFLFFGAPVGLIFTIDRRLTAHSWLDLGLFVQNFMVAARARGLDTCPQVSVARFHPVLARHLPMGEHEVTACGMSLGQGDWEQPVNQVRMPREGVAAFAHFTGFAGR